MVLVLCTLPDNALYLRKYLKYQVSSFEKVSKRISELDTQTVGSAQFTKGHNSV